ncbi:lysophospholipid acyltransferase family protein [Ottowia sp.]|uniref:lysophospholipid acyltransferase family protein n=1 Tax=Ottowia sp. TaxID=1898956 RepID=UPI002B57DD43|nr:lysophospholipid acyltransferase family protein [Ottowia sp.]HOB65201.1 lysophospholipid acyltransferase family protein [Ottowia sp.]HPZ56789.1 lysophospholipid acyltransferase family protein [Ottowia sp.]HQD48185.1 lysophospholipid acyltransferase family protein [Ottowia sp.]
MLLLYRFASRWPLALLHGLGALLGWLTWAASPTYRCRIRQNAALAGYRFAQVRACVAHAGRMALEMPRLWFGAPVPLQWRQHQALLDAAYASGRGIVFMTPHMGCFEITAQVVGAHYAARFGPMTVLYRPARQPLLREVVEQARRREGVDTAPTTLAGVRQMIRALRAGRAVGLLPDQVPPEGQGVWSPVFGQPAYTMTLAARLIQQTGATPLLAWGERLPRAQGFRLHLRAFPEALSDELETAVGQINRAMEGLIRECPGQYLWGYGRYKTPRRPAA